MGCGASSNQTNAVQVTQRPEAAQPSIIPTQQQQPTLNTSKSPQPINKTVQEANKLNDSTAGKSSKAPNPEDSLNSKRSQVRESSSLNKQAQLTKTTTQQTPATTSQQHIPPPSVAEAQSKKPQQQNAIASKDSKMTLSPSKVSIRMGDSQAIAPSNQRTTEDTQSRNNDKKEKTGYGTSSAIGGITASRIQQDEEPDEKKKKGMKNSKKKGSVDPKLNALIKIYGFD